MTLALAVLGVVMVLRWLTGADLADNPPMVNTNHVSFYEQRAWNDPRPCVPDTSPATTRGFPGQRWCEKD